MKTNQFFQTIPFIGYSLSVTGVYFKTLELLRFQTKYYIVINVSEFTIYDS